MAKNGDANQDVAGISSMNTNRCLGNKCGQTAHCTVNRDFEFVNPLSQNKVHVIASLDCCTCFTNLMVPVTLGVTYAQTKAGIGTHQARQFLLVRNDDRSENKKGTKFE